MKHPYFKGILKESREATERGNTLTCLPKKLKRLKDPLKKLNKEKYGNISKLLELGRVRLEET